MAHVYFLKAAAARCVAIRLLVVLGIATAIASALIVPANVVYAANISQGCWVATAPGQPKPECATVGDICASWLEYYRPFGADGIAKIILTPTGPFGAGLVCKYTTRACPGCAGYWQGYSVYEGVGILSCPSGTQYTEAGCIAVNQPDQTNDPGSEGAGCSIPQASGNSGSNPIAGDPVVIQNGDLHEQANDYTSRGPHPLIFNRYYSLQKRSIPSKGNQGAFGLSWSSILDRTFGYNKSGTSYVYLEDGRTYGFTGTVGGKPFVANSVGRQDSLVENTGGRVTWTSWDGEKTTFTQPISGGPWVVTNITSLDGRSLAFNYSFTGTPPQVILQSMTDEAGQMTSFTWTGDLITQVTFPNGQTTTYSYSSPLTTQTGIGGNVLTAVTRTLGVTSRTVTYHYEDTAISNALTGITDERGVRYATWAYDDTAARVISAQHAGGADLTTFTYNDTALTRTVTNSLGKQTVYQFTSSGGVWQLSSINGQASTHCPASVSSLAFSGGFISSRTDEEGRVTTYLRDGAGKETSRTEASSTSVTRTITTAWDNVRPIPTQITETGKTTNLTYQPEGGSGGGPMPGGHTYWRVNISANNGASGMSISSVNMFYGAGGSDLTFGGTAIQSSNASSGVAANAFDHNPTSEWHPLVASNAWIGYHFPYAVIVNNVAVAASHTNFEGAYAPQAFTIDYSDDGTTWTTAWSVSGQTGWSIQEVRHFADPGFTYTGSLYGTRTAWRLRLLSSGNSGAYGVAEAQLRGAPGGTNQATGGTAYATEVFGAGYEASKAFDGNISTYWLANDSFQFQSLEYDFTSAVSIAELTLTARNDSSAASAPTSAVVEYWDSSTSVWMPAWKFTTTSFTTGQTKTFTDPWYVP